jgi:hemolysin activation/secretion protein
MALGVLVAWIAAPARAQEAGFDILEFVVDGNTTLPGIEIEKAVYPHLGYGKSIADVQAARAALEKVYQDAGYLTVTVDVPPQEVKNGLVRLKVVDGVVKKVVVTGNRYHSREYIRAQLPSIAPGTVPYFPDAQKELAAFNQVSGRSVTPVLRPGQQRGEVEMELRVQDQRPFHASFEVNNRQAPNTSPLRLQGSVRYDNLWGRDHSASLIYLLSPENTSEVSALSANYLFRPNGGKTIVAVYGVRARSTVATLGTSTVVGNSNILGARAIHPLPGTDRLFHNAVVGVDYKESLQDVSLGPGASLGSTVTYTPITAQYSATKRGDKGTTRGSLTTVLSMRGGLTGNSDREFADRRFRASANFITLRAELSREQNMKRGMVGYGRVVGHAASTPLINTEQFVGAGADGVRGYYEAEVLGDEGWLASAELRTPSLVGGNEPGAASELVLLGFVDAASVRLKSPLAGQASRQTPWSTGFGLRYRRTPDLAASVEVGFPMEDAFVTKAGSTRVHFRVAYDF